MSHDLMERAIRGEESARHALIDLHHDDLRRMVEARLNRRISMRADASQRRLKLALVSFLPEEGEILVMHHIEQLGTFQIALALGITEEAVKTRLLRALQRLRGLMESES